MVTHDEARFFVRRIYCEGVLSLQALKKVRPVHLLLSSSCREGRFDGHRQLGQASGTRCRPDTQKHAITSDLKSFFDVPTEPPKRRKKITEFLFFRVFILFKLSGRAACIQISRLMTNFQFPISVKDSKIMVRTRLRILESIFRFSILKMGSITWELGREREEKAPCLAARKKERWLTGH